MRSVFFIKTYASVLIVTITESFSCPATSKKEHYVTIGNVIRLVKKKLFKSEELKVAAIKHLVSPSEIERKDEEIPLRALSDLFQFRGCA